MEKQASIKLHLGCGFKKLAGWVNVDFVPACQPDLVHDLTQPLPFDNLTVDEILAEDLLEHFDKYMRFIVFHDWARVLKVGGTIAVRVPDFEKILWKYCKFGFNNFVDFIFGETMLASKSYIGPCGSHKWGYSRQSLKEFVALFGIETIIITREGLNIRLVGTKKRHVSSEEVDALQIYSHANSFGDTPYLSLGEVKKKIQIFQQKTTS